MKCLDSDFLVAILRGDEQALEKSKAVDEEGKAFTTSINAYEILFGAKKSKKEMNLEESRKILAKLLMLPFDEKASEKASDIHKELSQKGTQLDLRDIFIAATAMSNGCSLVTRNTKHFSKIKELKIEKW